MSTDLPNRHRPRTFDDVLGNETAIQALKAQIALPNDKRKRVILLTGLSGGGKNTLAYIFAEAVNGEVTEHNCSRMTGKDSADEIADGFQYLAASKDYTVQILNEAARLSKNAQDSLLDPLEKCPAHVFVILCTSTPELLKKDIRNRCLEIEVKPLSEKDSKRLVKRVSSAEGMEIPSEAVAAIIGASDGSARAILSNIEAVHGALSTGAEVHEAVKLLSGPGGDDADGKALYNALANGGDWVAVVRGFKGKEPESIRRGVLGYANAVFLASKNPKALVITQIFASANTYDSGMPGITVLSSMAKEALG